MKWPTIVAIAVVIVVVAIWTILWRTSDKHPEMMSSLAGCYFPSDADPIRKIDITASGSFSYRGMSTLVAPYEDKQSLSLLPQAKVDIPR